MRLASVAMLAPALLLVASAAAAQQPDPIVPDTAAITTAAVDIGRAIFHGKGTCFMCHGAKLEGTQVAPTLKQHKWRDAKDGKLDEIFRVATHGVPSTVMVAFPGSISKAEALSVASYIWSVNHRDAKP